MQVADGLAFARSNGIDWGRGRPAGDSLSCGVRRRRRRPAATCRSWAS